MPDNPTIPAAAVEAGAIVLFEEQRARGKFTPAAKWEWLVTDYVNMQTPYLDRARCVIAAALPHLAAPHPPAPDAAVEAAVLAEREACAEVALSKRCGHMMHDMGCVNIAAAIRARSAAPKPGSGNEDRHPPIQRRAAEAINPDIPSPAREEIEGMMAERDMLRRHIVIFKDNLKVAREANCALEAERDALAERLRQIDEAEARRVKDAGRYSNAIPTEEES